MLALCLMLLGTYYAQNYAGIIGRSLLATKLKIAVIQCSANYNTNIDTAFKYLAAKALQLKKLSVNLLTHVEAACCTEKCHFL